MTILSYAKNKAKIFGPSLLLLIYCYYIETDAYSIKSILCWISIILALVCAGLDQLNKMKIPNL